MYQVAYEAILKGFPKTITPPPELKKLVDYANANEHQLGGSFELFADEEGKCMTYWSGVDFLDGHFAQFGVGPSGSPTGIWRDDDGKECIVHLSSDERHGDIIADTFVNYLRILAIGYSDVNESCEFDIQAYNKLCERENLTEGHYPKFKAWVEQEFKTTVPANGHAVFLKERTQFVAWLERRINSYYKEHLAEHPLFMDIGKDLRTIPAFGRYFLSANPGKVGNTRYTLKNYYGLKAILNDDFTIRCYFLGGNDPKLNPFNGYAPGAIESNFTRTKVQEVLGEPQKILRKSNCEVFHYEIKTASSLRSFDVYFNPEKEKDQIWKMLIY
jgi:hypothetical protein